MSRATGAVLAAVVVAAVFVVAGISKLARPEAWRRDAAGLGVPRRSAEVVPFAEIAVGALLLVGWQRATVAWVACVLLVAFTLLLGWRLAHGQRPPCACFGSLSSRPIGPGHLVRNSVLVAAAVLAATL